MRLADKNSARPNQFEFIAFQLFYTIATGQLVGSGGCQCDVASRRVDLESCTEYTRPAASLYKELSDKYCCHLFGTLWR